MGLRFSRGGYRIYLELLTGGDRREEARWVMVAADCQGQESSPMNVLQVN